MNAAIAAPADAPVAAPTTIAAPVPGSSVCAIERNVEGTPHGAQYSK
jgi:hypothetical protein